MDREMKPFPGMFPGTIKVPLDVPTLTRQADTVCKGEVVEVRDEGEVQYLVGDKPATFSRMIAIFRVDGLYKGVIPGGRIEIEFLQPAFPSSMEGLRQGEYVLVFLMKMNGRYQFANLTTSKMPISRGSHPIIRNRASPLEHIRKALIHSLGDADREVVLAAIEQLAKLKSKETATALQALTASSDAAIRGAAMAALLKIGESA